MSPENPIPTILWIALPDGLARLSIPYGRPDGRARLSIFVSPRLYCSQETSLEDFPYFWDWPGVLGGLRFFVEFPDGTRRPASPTSLDEDASAYWTALFPRSTLVRPYGFQDHRQKTIHSYSVRDTLQYTKELYQEAATQSPFSLLPIDPTDENNPLTRLRELSREYMKEVSNPTFEAVHAFFDRGLKPFSIEIPKFDFHELVSALGDHPVALRKLGLVIDLLFDPPAQETGKLRLALEWDSPSPQPRNLFPWTRYVLSNTDFRAAAESGSEIGSGYLHLAQVDDRLEDSHPHYDLVQVDAEGANLKLLNLANSLVNLIDLIDLQGKDQWPFDQPQEAGLPTLRSAGIALTCQGRAERLKERLGRIAEKGYNLLVERGLDDAMEFFADDLLRGYRLDVYDRQAKKWHSLCQREGSVRFPGTILDELPVCDEEEGYVKSASTTSPEPGSTEAYLHETLFRWDGWSLVVQRPGLALASASERPDHSANPTYPGFPFQARYAVRAGSLPRLRFGHTYRLRVRTVDLAGNSLPFDPVDLAHASEELTYRRYEPLNPPVLVPRRRYRDGESLERLVIRSNHDQTAADYAQVHDQYSASCERHVVPPKASASLAETHGALDTWLLEDEFEPAYNIILKEQGSLKDTDIVNVKTGEKEPSGAKIEVITSDQGEYVVHWEEQLPLPYLPDPAVLGVSLWQSEELFGSDKPPKWRWPSHAEVLASLPQHMGEDLGLFFVVQTPWDVNPQGERTSWPTAWPFRLVVRESADGYQPGTFHWEIATRELTVFLDKAQVLTLQCSSLPYDEALRTLGIWKWMEEVAHLNLNLSDENALLGLLWMLTPYRRLTLVHAVQQPLVAPEFASMEGSPNIRATQREKLGDTYVLIQTQLIQDTASTGKVELVAQWADPLDDPGDATGPLDDQGNQKMRTRQQGVVEFTVRPGDIDELVIGQSDVNCPPGVEKVRHEFGDTKHHQVRYWLRGTTRFREYFPPFKYTQSSASPGTPSVYQPPEEVQRVQYEIQQHTRSGEPVEINILSSARPAAPQVAYVVPTFGWTQQEIQNGFQRTRIGGGLRVYVERPWYSSGEGELLGVVLWPSDEIPIPEEMQKLVTQFGLDPLWAAKIIGTSLTVYDFRAPRPDGGFDPSIRGQGLSLQERPDYKVNVAGFQPFYNPDQGRWYFDLQVLAGFLPFYDHERGRWHSDVQVHADKLKAYYPFLRLALARYQPHSLDDAHLSPVVLTDPIQLVPTRTLTFTREGPLIVDVKLEGYRPRPPEDRSSLPAQRTEVEISAETFDVAKHALGDPLGWRPYPEGISASLHDVVPPLPGPTDDPHYFTWHSRLNLSLPRFPERLPMRLVVKEYEVFDEDKDVPNDVPKKDNRRVVYVDTIELGGTV